MLRGQHLFLRAPEPEDIDVLYRWENDPEVWRAGDTAIPYSRHHITQYVLEGSKDGIAVSGQLRLMICTLAGERAVGCVDLFDFVPLHRRAGTGILIGGAGDRNNGYATEALKLLTEYAFGTLGLHQLWCTIGSGNTPSIRLFEKAGFVKNGVKNDWVRKDGKWESQLFYQKIMMPE